MVVTATIAAPVLRAPSERIFGMEIVGRHHDPFTVMAQFAGAPVLETYAQPVTDITGVLLGALVGPVAAYNALVLLTFPLSAVAAYLLARQVGLQRVGATIASLAYAFSPFHIAHAAYHPHIAQTQWLPLYLLALWRCLDHASPLRVGLLLLAALAVTLSNFYGGLIAAAITPVFIIAYWFFVGRAHPQSARRLCVTAGSLAAIAVIGVAYGTISEHAALVNPGAFAVPRADLFSYSAAWWSYLVPPVQHPLFGSTARDIWTSSGVGAGLLEHQVSIGWGVAALALVAVLLWRVHSLRSASFKSVPVLVLVALSAFVCSLSPDWTIGGFTFVRPSGLMYPIAPMFRAYARFGVVVQLMTALLAGMAVDGLRTAGGGRARVVGLALVAFTAGEYIVWPPDLWRDVLPTRAHRWVVQQRTRLRVLDCAPLTLESESIRWLTGDRVSLVIGAPDTCLEPDLPDRLATLGYTHVLVRRGTVEKEWLMGHSALEGLRLEAHFTDGDVFAVSAAAPAIHTADIRGFSVREFDGGRSWRWMGADAAWTIVNRLGRPVSATLSIELAAFHEARQLDVLLDRRPVQTLLVDPQRRTYQIGPLDLLPGRHELMFRPTAPATIADDILGNGDRRPLTCAFGAWRWRNERRSSVDDRVTGCLPSGDSPALKQPDHQHHDRHDQQDVNEPADGVGRDETE